MEGPPGDGFALDADAMRTAGYRTVDLLVETLLDREAPPLRRATAAEMRARVGGDAPETGEPYEEVLDRLARDVLPFRSRGDHEGFLAFIPFAATWPSALADFVASACNIYAGSWMESAGASAVELEVLRWFASWLGLPTETAGALTTGGSAANLTALVCARESLTGAMSDDVVGYVGDHAHSSVARAARVLGFRPEQLRVLPTARDHRLAASAVAASIDADRSAGLRPLFVAASGGSTNTGDVDPLPELATVCRERDVWLHVDAAYGGFAALTDRGRRALAGIEHADSVTLDPHKWLFQPYECGAVLVRDGALLERAFEIVPHYLEDARPAAGGVNFADRGLQLSRAARALKVWVSVRTYGLATFRAAIDRALDVAEHARRRIDALPELELLAGSLGVVCFRRVADSVDEDELERLNAGLVAALEQTGTALVSSTRVDGRYAIRICILAPATTEATIDRVLEFLRTAEPADAPPEYERDPTLSRTGSIAASLARLGTEIAVRAGETVVRQGDATREFYVVVDGELDVMVDGEHVARLVAGEFFGELAALDWGAGYGYPRLATVVAATDATLRAIDGEALNDAAAEPDVRAALRSAVRERLPRRPRT